MFCGENLSASVLLGFHCLPQGKLAGVLLCLTNFATTKIHEDAVVNDNLTSGQILENAHNRRGGVGTCSLQVVCYEKSHFQHGKVDVSHISNDNSQKIFPMIH
jgi:hypothetical protein